MAPLTGALALAAATCEVVLCAAGAFAAGTCVVLRGTMTPGAVRLVCGWLVGPASLLGKLFVWLFGDLVGELFGWLVDYFVD